MSPVGHSIHPQVRKCRTPSKPEVLIRTLLCFAALAVYGVLAVFILPWPGGRAYLVSRWMPYWARTNLWFLGIDLDVTGGEHLIARSPCLFVSNHQGLLDIFSIPWLLRGLPIFYCVKREFRLYPFIGQLAIFCDQVFIDRKAPAGARAPLKKALEKLRSGMCTIIFPEGRRRSTKALQSFKRGAFWMALETGIPIVPITIVNSGELLPTRTFDLVKGTLRIVVDPPLETSHLTVDQLPELVTRVQDGMIRHLEPVSTETTQEGERNDRSALSEDEGAGN